MRFLPAVVVSAALILAAPMIGQLRAAIQSAFPGQYRTILVVIVAVSIAIALVIALWRIRDRKRARFGLIGASLAIGITYAWFSRTGDANVDAVERFHFVEYGIITLLFYRAWRPVGDASLFVLPVLAGILVGTLEEWLQWFVPARVGEARDVFLNLWAIICGLLFSVALDPPERAAVSVSRQSWRRVRRFAAVVLVAFALFFHFAHLGYEINDPDAGPFRSTYAPDELVETARERTQRWRNNPPLSWSRYSREDQYFSEGIALVQRRNRCWETGNILCAWRINEALERYYAPVIDTPSYVSASGHRWPQEQREDARQRLSAFGNTVAGPPEETIVVWSKPLFWAVVAVAVGLLAFV